MHRWTDGGRHREMNSEIGRWMNKERTDRGTEGQTDGGKMGRWMEKHR